MSGFVGKYQQPEDITVANNGFYPDISVAHFRGAMRVHDDVSNEHAMEALSSAMIEANAELLEWQSLQSSDTLADIDSERINDTSTLVIQYRTAVYQKAMARLLEKKPYPDAVGKTDAESVDEVLQRCYQRATESIRRIMNEHRTHIELI